MGAKERNRLGILGREYTIENYNFVKMQEQWVSLIEKVLEDKDKYNGIRFKEIA